MLASTQPFKSLTLRLVYTTYKSSKQTTPKLFRNPALTKSGYFKKAPKNYNMDLSTVPPEKHYLYYNVKEQNKILRKKYTERRLYKLGIRPIHVAGERIYQRELKDILYELSNIRLLKGSFGRTLQNLRQITTKNPQVLKSEDKGIVLYAIQHLHDRNMASMLIYQFYAYLRVRMRAKLPCTDQIFYHFYKFVEGESWGGQNIFKVNAFLMIARYVFSRTYGEEFRDLFWTKKIQFKLFEDIQPTVKSLQEMIPKVFSDERIKAWKQDKIFYNPDMLKVLEKVPGGLQLAKRFT